MLYHLDRRHRLLFVPFQRAGAAAGLGLSAAEAEAAAWTVSPDGQQSRGAQAVATALDVAFGSHLLRTAYSLAPIRLLADRAYALVATHRSKLPGTLPYCADHPDDCEIQVSTSETS